MVIVALRDRVAGRFLNLQVERNDKVACRGFVNAMASIAHDRNNLLVTNPEDFDLVYIGEFDTHSGLVSDNNVRVLMTGLQATECLEVDVDDA